MPRIMITQTLLCILAIGTPTLAGFTPDRKNGNNDDNCDLILADALSKFVSTSVGHSHNFLLWMMGMERDGGVGVDSIRHLGDVLHLDLVDPGQQKEIAIILCHAPSLTYLSRTFDLRFEQLDDFVENYVRKIYINHNLEVLFTLGDIIMDMLKWTRHTGYPTTPLRGQNGDDVMEFLRDMEERLDTSDDVRDLWVRYNKLYPLGLDLDLGEEALLLTGKHSLTTLSERLGLPALELEALATLDDVMLHQYEANVSATLRLFKVAHEYGLLDLDWS